MPAGFYGDAAAADEDGTATDSDDGGGLADYDPPDPDPPSDGGGFGDDDDDDDDDNEGPSGFYNDAAAADPSGGSTDSPDNDESDSFGGTSSGSDDSGGGSGWVSEPPEPPDVDYDLAFENREPDDWLEDSFGNLSGGGSSGDSDGTGDSTGSDSDGGLANPEGPAGYYGDAAAGTPIDADDETDSDTNSTETTNDMTNDYDTDDLSGFFGDAAAAGEDGTATDSEAEEWTLPERLQDVEITAESYGDYDRGGMAGVDSEDTLTYTTDQYGEVFFGENEEGEQTLMAPEGFELDSEAQDALASRLDAMAGAQEQQQPQPEQQQQQLPANFEERIAALMASLQMPDQAGGSDSGGGLSPVLGFVALLALGGGTAYYVANN
ncbi:hypothetical protein EXE53_15380 [Halorubrum sp. SD626R]|uniref:hypothetical protein n=1 Tax=Halorubrum sp. SD626R TaxID=1419722 RepID=UPI0010FA3BAB|nr:hypothetical protein [Halorubrum sp. SD626R]TKX79544.1 hypothetical protein EXE53_15380 [Halorubrum sp. SD626R]